MRNRLSGRWVIITAGAAVVVAVSAPHREEAFAAGRWCIDKLKETVPIWKREAWEGGEHWAVDAQHIVDLDTTSRSAGTELPRSQA